jgi:acetyl/propionyl-CoA carboxylase alpha subunit
MLAKLIVHAESRISALDRLAWALERFVVLGVTTNIEFLRALIDHPDFRAGRIDTQFLETHQIQLPPPVHPDQAMMAATLFLRHNSVRRDGTPTSENRGAPADGPWRMGRAWRNV